MNKYNKNRDTKSPYILLSHNFYYFGSAAPVIPPNILFNLGYKNGIGYRKYPLEQAVKLVNWVEKRYGNKLNLVIADPFDFDKSAAHYSVETNKVSLP